MYLRPRSLLLAFVEGQEGNVGHLHHLETYTRDITDGMSLTTKSCHQNFIVLLPSKPIYLNEIQATVIGDESGNLLAVLDQLDPDALPNSRVRLLGFNTTAKAQRKMVRVSLQGGAQIGLLVLLVVPFLLTAVVPQLSGGTKSTTLAYSGAGRSRGPRRLN
uniref:Uncharacterized protein n=1 Tax=Pygocentrus nattereri TaxID=42514 RepID=A0A3B4DBR3_PYGNA